MALSLFSDGARHLSTEELVEAMNVDIEVVKRVLHSLSCGKFQLLNKSGPGAKKVDAADRFEANRAFKSKVARFTVPMASLDNAVQIKEKVPF